MTQIILNNSIYLPETSRDKYSCYESQLGSTVDMISGRRVLEVRGWVYIVSYQYDYMGNDLMRQVTPYCGTENHSRRRCCRTMRTSWWFPHF